MSKGHLPVIAKVQNPTTRDELGIFAGRIDGNVAEVYTSKGSSVNGTPISLVNGAPISLTYADIVSLRDQLDAWLKANPT